MQIENRIKEFILKNLYFAEDNTPEDDASFLETGVVDSTGVMELVAFVQTEFGVTVEPQEIVVENFDSVRKVARFVRRKLSLPEVNGSPVAKAFAPKPSTAAERCSS
ncbi:MAG: acyl carrier protein [Verrucomicrobiota bacterium]|nr:acyl carrier protein [Verrucomicrobiota bacterium]